MTAAELIKEIADGIESGHLDPTSEVVISFAAGENWVVWDIQQVELIYNKDRVTIGP